jgi:sugar lactone lactonase YvrE
VLDSSDNLWVADYNANSILEFASTASGNIAPMRIISGSNTGISSPYGMAIDKSGEIYVSSRGGTNIIEVFAPSASGNVAPIRTIAGSNTGLSGPTGITLFYPSGASAHAIGAKPFHR